MPRRRLNPVNHAAAMDSDDTRTIGRHIRRIRHARDKSLRVIAGLAGMNKSTLHRIERGQRDVTLSEIVALANALDIAPSTLIRLPILTPANGHTDAATGAATVLIP
jgi:transcriptional regulator with XRE-family HTH domain